MAAMMSGKNAQYVASYENVPEGVITKGLSNNS